MPDTDPTLYRLDKVRIRESFDAAADKYDDAAILQREVGDRIIERLDLIRLQPDVILDLGAGTGILSRELKIRYRKAGILSLDLAPRMLQAARKRSSWLSRLFNQQHFVCGDAERLPIADNSVDLVFSNLAIQWCGELEQTFKECRRILKPGGLLMFSTFGPDTLKELRASWQAADLDSINNIHVNDFIDMHDIGDAMLRAGLNDAVMDVEHFTLTYPDVFQLMRELKTIGAHNVANQRRHSLTGKKRLKDMVSAYEQYRNNDTIPATYEVVYGHAWAPETKQSHITVSIESITSGR